MGSARPGFALAIAAGLAGLLGASPSAAVAASPFERCYRHSPIDCAIIRTPLDRSGRVPGTVPLHVIRLKARAARKGLAPAGAVVPLAGGPGQSSLPLAADYADVMATALRTRDLLVFDPRGTGLSGLLRCRSLERRPTGDPRKAVQACAARLGPARSFYTSAEAADDIEAARRVEGVDKLMLYGTSYGTKVALAYAQRYPEHVESMILDSVVGLD